MLTLIWVGEKGKFTPLPVDFPLITQKLQTFVPGLLSLTHPSLQILGKNQTDISDFRISGQSFINKNCHNSRTSDIIDMKLEPVTKLYKKNKIASKEIDDDDVMSANCGIIVIILSNSEAGLQTHSL